MCQLAGHHFDACQGCHEPEYPLPMQLHLMPGVRKA
jgi:hypothetical protein